MVKIRIIIVLILVVLFSWVAIVQVYAGEKCSGKAYENHPALQAECLHQQNVNQENSSAYPEPEIVPYPAPIEIIRPTSAPISTPALPTEPPPLDW